MVLTGSRGVLDHMRLGQAEHESAVRPGPHLAAHDIARLPRRRAYPAVLDLVRREHGLHNRLKVRKRTDAHRSSVNPQGFRVESESLRHWGPSDAPPPAHRRRSTIHPGINSFSFPLRREIATCQTVLSLSEPRWIRPRSPPRPWSRQACGDRFHCPRIAGRERANSALSVLAHRPSRVPSTSPRPV